MNKQGGFHIWVLLLMVGLAISQNTNTTITPAIQPSGANQSTIAPSPSSADKSTKASSTTAKSVITTAAVPAGSSVTPTPVGGNSSSGNNSKTQAPATTPDVNTSSISPSENAAVSQPTSAPKAESTTANQSNASPVVKETTSAPPTTTSTPKNNSSVTIPVTSEPNNSSGSTSKGTSTSPTAKPSTSTPPSASTANPVSTSKNTNTTNTATPVASVTPAAETNQTVVTPAPTNASATTGKPTVQSTSPSNSSISTTPATVNISSTASPTNASITSSTSITDKPTSTIVTTAGPSSSDKVYISEILMDKQGSFQQVELQFSNNFDVGHYTMVVINGDNNKSTFINLTNFDSRNDTTQILTISMNAKNLPAMSNSGVGIAIYNTNSMTPGNMGPGDWTPSTTGLVDALVIGTSYDTTSKQLIQILTPGVYPFVLDPSLYGQTKSISRCSSSSVRSSDMYALIYPSIGLRNDDRCQGRYQYHNTLSLRIHGNCRLLEHSDGSPDQPKIKELVIFVVKEVNKNCQCGLTKMHIIGPKESDVHCCGDLSLDMQFVAPNKEQDDAFLASYKTFIQSTNNLTIGGQEYTLDKSCYSHCCASPQPVTDNSGKQVQVTIAVIVTCLVVFLVILAALFMYMRRKKIAVYQFRMSRLAEEEDDIVMDHADCDEFIGGQEATFDIKR